MQTKLKYDATLKLQFKWANKKLEEETATALAASAVSAIVVVIIKII
jgi:hypothetical protein